MVLHLSNRTSIDYRSKEGMVSEGEASPDTRKTSYMGIGIAIGAGIGVPLGVVLGLVSGNMGLMALGIAIGVGCGVAVGAALDARSKPQFEQTR
jgi:hypothetical protein